ncbi:MAG: M15 family metallopeptidase [Minisyncoccia bacterium]
MKLKFFKIIIIIALILLIVGQIIGFGALKLYLILKELEMSKNNLEVYQRITNNYHLLTQRKIAENLELQQKVIQQEALIQSFYNDLEGLKQNVNNIIKLRNLDEELLKKYSKIYFLNENYVPKSLLPIDPQYVSNSEEQYIHGNVMPFLYSLLENAKKDGIDLKVKWGYRSFWEQASIKSSSAVSYGSGANKFIADQGYSEHQLGTTVDFTTSEFNRNASMFNKTKAYQWLLNNAYKYGFILSYPENNKYYIFEPWHWRFIGIRLATKLHNENKHFYDLDQREIDEYLISIFDW